MRRAECPCWQGLRPRGTVRQVLAVETTDGSKPETIEKLRFMKPILSLTLEGNEEESEHGRLLGSAAYETHG